MRDAIKLISITGQPVYIRDSYNVIAIATESNGDLTCTTIHMISVMFRVRNPVEEVASLLGWEPKQIEAPKE